MPFERACGSDVQWYTHNEAWWRAIKSGEWEDYTAASTPTRLAGSRRRRGDGVEETA